MIETTLIGGVLGGIMRLAPELFKFMDRKDERKHELSMLEKEHDFAKLNAEVQMKTIQATVVAKEYETLGLAYEAQGKADGNSYKIVASISALVRPLVTYAFVLGYFLVKMAAYGMAMDQGGQWDSVLLQMWTTDDLGILSMILGYWFVSRSLEKNNK